MNKQIQISTISLMALIFTIIFITIAMCYAVLNNSSVVNQNNNIKNILSQRLQHLEIQNVSSLPVGGIYEVTAKDGDVFYVDKGVSLILRGELFNGETLENMTRTSQMRKRQAEFQTLPLHLAIREVRGNGKRTMVVFADPDCPYCHILEQTTKEINNVTIYTFLFPLDQIHKDARRKAELIWCSKDRNVSWRNWMDKKILPDSNPKCSMPQDKLFALGQHWHVSGTPTLLFPNGNMLSGTHPIAELEEALSH